MPTVSVGKQDWFRSKHQSHTHTLKSEEINRAKSNLKRSRKEVTVSHYEATIQRLEEERELCRAQLELLLVTRECSESSVDDVQVEQSHSLHDLRESTTRQHDLTMATERHLPQVSHTSQIFSPLPELKLQSNLEPRTSDSWDRDTNSKWIVPFVIWSLVIAVLLLLIFISVSSRVPEAGLQNIQHMSSNLFEQLEFKFPNRLASIQTLRDALDTRHMRLCRLRGVSISSDIDDVKMRFPLIVLLLDERNDDVHFRNAVVNVVDEFLSQMQDYCLPAGLGSDVAQIETLATGADIAKLVTISHTDLGKSMVTTTTRVYVVEPSVDVLSVKALIQLHTLCDVVTRGFASAALVLHYNTNVKLDNQLDDVNQSPSISLRARQRLARNTLQQLWGATFSENKDVQSSGSIDDTQALVAALMSRVLTYVI